MASLLTDLVGIFEYQQIDGSLSLIKTGHLNKISSVWFGSLLYTVFYRVEYAYKYSAHLNFTMILAKKNILIFLRIM